MAMRWPIQIQLLLPNLSIVLLAIVLASGTSAHLGAMRARQQQEENLRRVVATLTDSPAFPLTENVLHQMSGLSGAEFVLLDNGGRLKSATVVFNDSDDRARLAQLPGDRTFTPLSSDLRVVFGQRAYLASRLPVRPRGSLSQGSLVVLYPEDQWWAVTRRAAWPALLSGAIAAAAVVLVTTALARRFVRPIQQLCRQTAVIANGQFLPVAVPDRNDEIRDLAVSINQMTEKLGRYEDEVRRSERLRTLGQLGAGIAHQLRNSATGARMAVELHRQTCAGNDDESLEVALRQMRLMESYVQRFLSLGRRPTESLRPLRLDVLVDDVLQLVRPACAHARTELCLVPCPEPLEVLGDEEALRQVLVNLVLNAMEAASRAGGASPRLVVELAHPEGGWGAVRIGDTGPGPALAMAERLFEPFASDKPDGTGLGLFVVRQVVEAHRGRVRWERRDAMTWFIVELPLG